MVSPQGRTLIYTLAIGVALFPTLALGQTATTSNLAAGFSAQEIWLSTVSPVAGDKVTIYTVVYDSDAVPIAADVNFEVDNVSVGTEHVTLAVGATQVVSVPWTAIEGSHAIEAVTENVVDSSSKAPETLATGSTPLLQVNVAAAPPESATVATAAGALSQVENAADSLRIAGITYLTNQINAASSGNNTSAGLVLSPDTSKSGAVLGTSTENIIQSSSTAPSGAVLNFEKFLLVIFKSSTLFYIVLAIIVIALLWLFS